MEDATLPPLTDQRFYTLPWERALVEFSQAVAEQVRFNQTAPDPELARAIQQVGTCPRNKQGIMYEVTWAGKFTVFAYPTGVGKCTLVKAADCPVKDALKAFLVFLCGSEPVVRGFVPPRGLPRLSFTRERAIQLLANFKVCFLALERTILADPSNVLPVKAEITQTHPATRHLPKAHVRALVNKSGDDPKEIESSGPPLETAVFDSLNFELGGNELRTPAMDDANLRSGIGIALLRGEMDHNREVEGRIARIQKENRDQYAEIALAQEDTTHWAKQAAKGIKTTNKDHGVQIQQLGEINQGLKKHVEIAEKTLEEQKKTNRLLEEHNTLQQEHAEATAQHETNEELRFTESSNQLAQHDDRLVAYHKDDVIRDNARAVQLEKVKAEIINHVDDRFERLAQYLEISRIDLVQQIDQMKTDLLTIARRQGHWIKKMALDNYAATWRILKEVPDITAKRLAELLEVKRTRVYKWFEKLADFGLTGSEKRVPDGNSSGAGSPLEVHPAPSPEIKPVQSKVTKRRVLHFFLRVIGKEAKPELNKQLKPEDEKT